MAPTRQPKGKAKAVSRGSDDDDDDNRRRKSDQARKIDNALGKAKDRRTNRTALRIDSEDNDDEDDEEEEEEQRGEQGRSEAARLREEIEHLQAELTQIRAMIERQTRQEASTTPGASGSSHGGGNSASSSQAAKPTKVPVPDKKAQVTIRELRATLGLGESDPRWLEIRAIIRDLIVRVGLDLTLPWKLQDKTQLGTIYTLIRNRLPELDNFASNWAAEYLVQETFNHRCSHQLAVAKRRRRSAATPAAGDREAAAGPHEDTPPRDNTPPFGQDLGPPPALPPRPLPRREHTPPPAERSRPDEGRNPPGNENPGRRNPSPRHTNASGRDIEPTPTASGIDTGRGQNPAPRRASTGSQNPEPAGSGATPSRNRRGQRSNVANNTDAATTATPVTPAPRASTRVGILATKKAEAAATATASKPTAPAKRKAPVKKTAAKRKAAKQGKGKGKGKSKAAEEDEDVDVDEEEEEEDENAPGTDEDAHEDDGTHLYED
ncbi:hypothetical protein FRC06_008299 [Ceratobasidium sp. 370]|nr:hypothetical protein FRC06_008299 [Ceratobasidium sp. 370]